MTTITPAVRPDLARLEPVLALDDPLGVLSVYADADPALGGGFAAPVRAGLRRVLREARSEWPRARRLALEARLDELEPELEAFVDPRAGGRGRALFVGLGAGELQRVSLRAPLPSLVAVEEAPLVLPLFAVLQDGRPAGVAVLSRERAALGEWELGERAELVTVAFAPVAEPGRARTNPAVPQSFPERDRFESGAEARFATRLREAGRRARELAAERGWDAVVVDADPRLADAFAAGFGDGIALLPAPAWRAAEAVAALRREARSRLREVATTAGVDAALELGRVEHLLLPASAEAEPLLRRALATSAEVTVVDGAAEAAALLRW